MSAALRCLLRTKQPELLEVDLIDDLGTKGGDVCGGKLTVFVEPVWADVRGLPCSRG